jgi:predicted secreted protein
MSPFTAVAVYLTIWWTVLFAVLPIGVVSHAEAGVKPCDGVDPGSPVDPKLKRKFITTTWVSAVLFAILWAGLHFHLFHLPELPAGMSHSGR